MQKIEKSPENPFKDVEEALSVYDFSGVHAQVEEETLFISSR